MTDEANEMSAASRGSVVCWMTQQENRNDLQRN